MIDIMQRKTIAAAVIIVLVILLVVLSALDHRGQPHITFSQPSGFYDDAFDLTIMGGERYQIRYTTDGSTPTPDSTLYSGPIHLTDASGNPDLYADRLDVYLRYLPELLIENGVNLSKLQPPDGLVDKCNVIRASVFDADGSCLYTTEAVYFIGFSQKSGYDGLMVASVNTDPANLFGYETGIYILGASFDKARPYLSERKGHDANWGWWDANYRNHGREWEREAVLHLFDENGNPVVSQECGIRIQGQYSRSQLPRSLGLFARIEYSGTNKFQADVLHRGYMPHKLVLFAGGTDETFKCKDVLISQLVSSLNVSTKQYRPCALFLNGEYWGVYWLTDEYDADYVANRYGVAKNDVILVKNYELKEGYEADFALADVFYNYVADANLANDNDYGWICSMADVDTLVDYMAISIYVARLDWSLSNNAAIWRTRDQGGAHYADGRWRWMLFDMNYGSLDPYYLWLDSIATAMESDRGMASLMRNDTFRKQLLERLLYLSNEIFIPERYDPLLDAYVALMQEPLAASNYRFFGDRREAAFVEYVQATRDFFEQRHAIIEQLVAKYETYDQAEPQ